MQVILVFTASRTTTVNQTLAEIRHALMRFHGPAAVRLKDVWYNGKPTFELTLHAGTDGSLPLSVVGRALATVDQVKVGGHLDLIGVNFTHPALRTSSPVSVV